MQRHPSTRSARLLTTAALVGTVLLGACGSDDDEPASEPAAAATASDDASGEGSGEGSDADADSGGDADGGATSDAGSGGDVSTDGAAELGAEVADDLMDAVDEDGTLDEAISSLSPETRFGVVAGQLDPEPEVVVDGSTIRFVFPGGSTADSMMACIVGGAFVDPGEVLVLEYPDGEVEC